MTFGLWPGVEVYFQTGRDPVAYVFDDLPSEGPVTMRKAEADRRIELKEYAWKVPVLGIRSGTLFETELPAAGKEEVDGVISHILSV